MQYCSWSSCYCVFLLFRHCNFCVSFGIVFYNDVARISGVHLHMSYPIGSMCGIFTYIYQKNPPNVGKYTIHGSYGYQDIPRVLADDQVSNQRFRGAVHADSILTSQACWWLSLPWWFTVDGSGNAGNLFLSGRESHIFIGLHFVS